MDECMICKKHEVEVEELIIYKDEFVSVCHYVTDMEANSNYLGYYLVEMIRHFDGIGDAIEDELIAMVKVTKRLANALLCKYGGERIYTFITGDGVKHMHEHVVMKHKGTPKQYKGCKVDEWPDAPRGSYDDIVALNDEIRKYMSKDCRPTNQRIG